MVEWRERGYVQDSDNDDEEDDLIDPISALLSGNGNQSYCDSSQAAHSPVRLSHSTPNSHGPLVVIEVKQRQTSGQEEETRPGRTFTPRKKSSFVVNDTLQDVDIDELQIDGNSKSSLSRRKGRVQSNAKATDIYDIPSSPQSHVVERNQDSSWRTKITQTSSPCSRSSLPLPPHCVEDIPDSPLTTPPTSPSPNPSSGEGVQVEQYDTEAGPKEVSRGGRTFRPRNAIQLHPYAVEDRLYRQEWHARGLRPIITAKTVAEIAADHIEFESQPHEFNDDDNQGVFFAGSSSSSPVAPEFREDSSFPPVVRTQAHLADDNSIRREDASGDFHALENQLPVRLTKNPQKLRLRKFKIPGAFVEHEADGRLPVSLWPKNNPVDIFSLAPETDSNPRSPVDPRGTSTSPPRSHHHDAQPVGIEDCTLIESEPEPVEKNLRKRLRGVLPASWVRLDHQSKVPAPQNAISTTPSCKHTEGTVRGVAKKLTPGTRRIQSSNKRANTAISVSDSDESEMFDRPEIFLTSLARSQTDNLSRERNVQEAEEENIIDFMLPPVPRKRRKVSDTCLFPSIKHASLVGVGPLSSSNIIRDRVPMHQPLRLPKLRKSKWRAPPRLGVLDSSALDARDAQPDFLRVAMRQARSRASLGRHSPASKVFVMHSRQDNAEIDSILLDWVDGRIGRTSTTQLLSHEIKTRKSVTEVVYDMQQKLLPTIKPQVNSIRSSSSPLQPSPKPRNRHRKKRIMQQRLHVIRPTALDAEQIHAQRPQHKGLGREVAAQSHKIGRPHGVLRPGHLESLFVGEERAVGEETFMERLHMLDNRFDDRGLHQQRVTNPLLDRFFEECPIRKIAGSNVPKSVHQPLLHSAPNVLRSGPPFRRRKRLPRQINSEELKIDIASPADLGLKSLDATKQDGVLEHANVGLQDLAPYGTYHSIDFDTRHFATGTYFDRSTLIGGGELDLIIKSMSRNLNAATTSLTMSSGPVALPFTGWCEEASCHFQNTFDDLVSLGELMFQHGESLQGDFTFPEQYSTTLRKFRDIFRYIATSLFFMDATDRIDFVARLVRMVEPIINTAGLGSQRNHYGNNEHNVDLLKHRKLRYFTYVLILLAQLLEVARHPVVALSTREEIEGMLQFTGQRISATMLAGNIRQLWTLSRKPRAMANEVIVLDSEQVEAESLVVLHHVLSALQLSNLDLWSLLSSAFAHCIVKASRKVPLLEDLWRDIFALLPAVKLDASGTLNIHSVTSRTAGIWLMVKPLLSAIFDSYSRSDPLRKPPINSYLRATLSRCFGLVGVWECSVSESVLGHIFDFFARRGLKLLDNEEAKNSTVLSAIRDGQDILLQPGDRSFEIFLKTLYIGLIRLGDIYIAKKIQNIAWRFVPASAQLLDKDQDLRQDDLDARRNHHDILAILYCASPSGYRPKIEMIQNLVDFRRSHSEVCRINIRTWANLTGFQLSLEEDFSAITPFAKWFSHMVKELIEQHQTARPDATHQAAESRSRGILHSDTLVESTIASNEKQIEALLKTALGAMCDLIKCASSNTAVEEILGSTSVSDVLKLFNPKCKRLNSVVMVALEIYMAFFKRCNQLKAKAAVKQPSDDSQDFGDWSELENLEEMTTEPIQLGHDHRSLVAPIQQLLSDSLGAETFWDEPYLKQLTDTWVYASQYLTSTGQHDWLYFLHPSSPGSWQQLRDTDQSRKFFLYYLVHLLQSNPSIYVHYKETFLSYWLTSLVDRESLLKFQHDLTSALLNVDSTHPMLQNLPFAVNKESQKFEISLLIFRSRRLALIDAVLANMRRTFEDTSVNAWKELPRLRQMYGAMLKKFMQAMKEQYQNVRQASSEGAYVDFIQSVIARLHQYTAEICPVDAFFTDSVAFPVPDADPEYVVGRLRSYGLESLDQRARKKLAVFVQSRFELAMITGTADDLVAQLATAVDDQLEDGSSSVPTLRELLLCGIFPAYIEPAFTSDYGWITAKFFLDAAFNILDDLVFRFDSSHSSASAKIVSILTSFLRSLYVATECLDSQNEIAAEPHVIASVIAMFRSVAQAACLADYLARQGYTPNAAIGYVMYFVSLAPWLVDHLAGRNPTFSTPNIDHDVSLDLPYADLKLFAKRELQSTFDGNWTKQGDKYYIAQRGIEREVITSPTEILLKHADVKIEIGRFMAVLRRLPTFGRCVADTVPAEVAQAFVEESWIML